MTSSHEVPPDCDIHPLLRKPLGSKERVLFWGKKNGTSQTLLLGWSQAEGSEPRLWSRPVCGGQWGKGRPKKKEFFFSHNIRFPHSALSQNHLFESGVLSYTHGAKGLLIPSRKSASSVCLQVPSSVKHTTTCQPFPVICLCCTTDVVKDISGVKSGACVLTVAHTYTYSRNSITSSFSRISYMFFRISTLPKKQWLGYSWTSWPQLVSTKQQQSLESVFP